MESRLVLLAAGFLLLLQCRASTVEPESGSGAAFTDLPVDGRCPGMNELAAGRGGGAATADNKLLIFLFSRWHVL